MVDRDALRGQILGTAGPYADPRVALDPLDDLATWLPGLEPAASDDAVDALIDLIGDDDPVVATGAVLALDLVRTASASVSSPRRDASTARLAALVAHDVDHGSGLDRAPTGFAVATAATLRAELARVVCRATSAGSASAIAELVDSRPAGVRRADLVAELAARLPALVVARARDWVGPDDSAVVARLAEPRLRIAVAGAARPWTPGAIEAIRRASTWHRWHDDDTSVLERVMRDEAPELVRPIGTWTPGSPAIDLDGRWWIVADRHWDRTLWRDEAGRFVLERVEGGVGIWTSLRSVSEDVAARILDAAITGAPWPDPG